MKAIIFIIEKTKTGYSAYNQDYPIFSTAQSLNELIKNINEAVNLYCEETETSFSFDKLELELDFKQFFEYYKIINAKHLANRINMNESLLSQYVNGKKKPSKKQVERIVGGLHEIGSELMELTLI